MSEAGDDIPIEETQEEQVEVTATDAPKGKLSVEEALQVRLKYPASSSLKLTSRHFTASPEDCSRSRWSRPWSP